MAPDLTTVAASADSAEPTFADYVQHLGGCAAVRKHFTGIALDPAALDRAWHTLHPYAAWWLAGRCLSSSDRRLGEAFDQVLFLAYEYSERHGLLGVYGFGVQAHAQAACSHLPPRRAADDDQRRLTIVRNEAKPLNAMVERERITGHWTPGHVRRNFDIIFLLEAAAGALLEPRKDGPRAAGVGVRLAQMVDLPEAHGLIFSTALLARYLPRPSEFLYASTWTWCPPMGASQGDKL